MGVDLLIGVEQPHAAFAIEIADRAAQAMDRLGQLLGFLGALARGCVELGKLLLGDQIDRADALALGGEALERRGFSSRRGSRRVERQRLGQALGQRIRISRRRSWRSRRSATAALRRAPRAGPALARVGRALVGRGHLLSRGADGVFGFAAQPPRPH
jgi:hypothetical protein